MRVHYHETDLPSRPAILGMTASPQVRDKLGDLLELESNLNAICRTPKLNRAELAKFVHLPEMITLKYPPEEPECSNCPAVVSLRGMIARLDINEDPWVVHLRSHRETNESEKLSKALLSGKTACRTQLRTFCRKAEMIHRSLGSAGAGLFVWQCIQKFLSERNESFAAVDTLEGAEDAYLKRKLGEVNLPSEASLRDLDGANATPKVRLLLSFLEGLDVADFAGLVFVETRAEVAVLSQQLSNYFSSKGRYTISTFVGESSFSGKSRSISDLAEIKNQKETLEDFRQGRRNLVVTTSALEEGIDVAKCSVVICFERPRNLKSFIQRRGRARKAESMYAIMFEEGCDPNAVSTWQNMEHEMRQLYMEEMRKLQMLQVREAEESGYRIFGVEETGYDLWRINCWYSPLTGNRAKLTLNDAVQHLYHFCATLPADPFSESNPHFFFKTHAGPKDRDTVEARVRLPTSVDIAVREAHSKCQWQTENMAKRDAAFEAYVALYHFGLIDDNLLPKGRANMGCGYAYTEVEKRPNVLEVNEQIDLWPSISEQWQNPAPGYGSLVKLRLRDQISTESVMLLPRPLPPIGDFAVYWDLSTTFDISIRPEEISYPKQTMGLADETTNLLLRSIFRGRISGEQRGFSARFVPADTLDIQGWLGDHSGSMKVEQVCDMDRSRGGNAGLVRDLRRNGAPSILRDIIYVANENEYAIGGMDTDETQEISHQCSFSIGANSIHQASGLPEEIEDRDEPHLLLDVQPLPKRTDFLHRLVNESSAVPKKPIKEFLHAEQCEVDKLPFRYAQFAAFIPAIMHKVHQAMLVDRLCATVLSNVGITDQSLVCTAITASAARETSNYERLEFLGDSILKTFTSLTLMASNPRYHEGILSHEKDHIVSNGNLASAAVQAGLPEFIITRPFTGRKWRPPYNDQMISEQPVRTREMSTKTLADVVEALIGAAYLDGGPNKALSCVSALLPEIPWLPWLNASHALHDLYEKQMQHAAPLREVEKLTGYDFKLKNILWEALTHPSYQGPSSNSSYQRLEFLGDSILDIIVTREAFNHNPPIPTHNLHLIRTALVNANVLGYFALRHSIPVLYTEYKADGQRNVTLTDASRPFTLIDAMRHSTTTIGIPKARKDCVARYRALETTINGALLQGSYYPWTALARLEPPKPFSDIIESVLGAIYIDSLGSLDACKTFLERLGLMPYLHRVLSIHIALLHPKEELGQLSNQDRVKYVMGKEGEEGAQRLTCDILIGERCVARVGDGLSVMECQTRAAEAACRVLRRQDGEKRCERLHGRYEDRIEEEKAVVEGKKLSVSGDVDMDYAELRDDMDSERDYDDDLYMTADEW
ncbi:MAG: hypothetical protein Q9217_000800 [Psora testacea]